MQDLVNYTISLLKARIIDTSSFVSERDGRWTVNKAFGGVSANTTYQTQDALHQAIARGLVQQFQNEGGLRAVS